MNDTPNQTAEQVIAEAMVNAGAPLMHSRVEESVAAALRAHGLLSEGAPSEDDREALASILSEHGAGTYLSMADAILARWPRAAVPGAAPDAREYMHAKCDCVPDLGPAHCHLCSADGSPVEWANCVAVQQVTDAPETVEVAFKTVEVERLGHLLVQLSPATPRNGAATVRRLMEEMNIKEVVS